MYDCGVVDSRMFCSEGVERNVRQILHPIERLRRTEERRLKKDFIRRAVEARTESVFALGASRRVVARVVFEPFHDFIVRKLMVTFRTNCLGTEVVSVNRPDEITTPLELRCAHSEGLSVREANMLLLF